MMFSFSRSFSQLGRGLAHATRSVATTWRARAAHLKRAVRKIQFGSEETNFLNKWRLRFLRHGRLAYGGEFRCDADQNDGSANAEFGEVLQFRDPDAFVGKVGAVGRIHIAQADDVTLDFNRAMPP
jgi:hypothetical protein